MTLVLFDQRQNILIHNLGSYQISISLIEQEPLKRVGCFWLVTVNITED